MEYNLNLSEQEINKILQILSKEPYIDVFDIINKIQIQANEQLKEKK